MVVNNWMDLSPNANHANVVNGEPKYNAEGINGLPAVQFDGTSSLAVQQDVGNRYTILTVSRLAGNRNARLLASRNQNWLLGYHGNYEDCYHPVNGWVVNRTIRATANPHLYIASSTGGQYRRMWSERGELTEFPTRANGSMGTFQMGAHWDNLRESSAGFVSEVLIYDRNLKSSERLSLSSRLSFKYGFSEVRRGVNMPVNRDVLGEYVIQYSVEDSNGNVSSVRRIVHVIEDPDAPVITLNGPEMVEHEMGAAFVDPGYTLTSPEGSELDASLVVVDGTVDDDKAGIYKLSYTYTADGKSAREQVRYVKVHDTQGPVITLEGDAVMKIEVGNEYVEPGFSATDAAEGEVKAFSHLERLPNLLNVSGFMQDGRDNNIEMLNFDQNGGFMSLDPVGVSTFEGNIVGLNGDGAFRALVPEISRNDDYQVMFHGYFYAKTDGGYEFGADNADDRCSVWVDLDQDGIFESNGDLGSEVVFTNYNGGGWKTYQLTEGFYKVAITFWEFGGGAWIRPRVNILGAGRVAVHPANMNQVGHWFSNPTSYVDISTPGTYTVEYSSYDSIGNSTVAVRTVVVVEDSTLPFISLNKGLEVTHEAGTPFTDPGATVKDGDNVIVKDDLTGAGEVDVGTPGVYSLNYTFTDAEGKEAEPASLKVIVVDTTAPIVEFKPDASGGTDVVKITAGESFEDPGLVLTDAVDTEVSFWTSLQIPTEGLIAYYRFDETAGSVAHEDWNNLHASLHNMTDANHVDGKSGKALDFSGGDAQHMTAPPFSIGGAFSFTSWVNYDRFNNWSRIIDFGNAANNHNLIVANVGGESEAHFGIRIGGTERSVRQTNFWSVDQWVHVAATVNSDGLMKIFKNGEFVAEFAGHVPQEMKRTGQFVGRSHWGNDQYFDGQMDDMLFYRRDLSAEEILRLFTRESTAIDTSKPATHTITYVVSDDAGNVVKAKRTVVVEPDPVAPIITLNGEEFFYHEGGSEFVDPGAIVKDSAGNLLQEGLLSEDTFESGTPGEYTISYRFSTEDGKNAVPVERIVIVEDTQGPVLTLKGKNPASVQLGATFVDFGVESVDAVDGEITPEVRSSNPSTGYVPGLLSGFLAGNMSFAANPGNWGIDPLGPSHSESQAAPPWANNRTIVYSGQIYDEDGKISFMEDIDDKGWLSFANEVVLNGSGWANSQSVQLEKGEGGWFDFEVRFSNGGGGAGRARTMGFGFDPEGNAPSGNDVDASLYKLPRNTPGEMDLFRVESERHNTLKTDQEGDFTITYTATDAAGNTTTVTRLVTVVDDPTIPTIAFIKEEDAAMTIEAGSVWVDPGVTVADSKGNPLDASKVVISGEIHTDKLGEQIIYYDFTSERGKEAVSLKRVVTIVDTTPPVISLTDGTEINVGVGSEFTDPGSVVTDNYDKNLVATVKLEGAIEGLVAHWKFNEGSGDKATDSVGEMDGTFVNFDAPDDAWVDGVQGKAIKLDGINDHITLPASAALDLQQFTISTHIKSDNYAQDAFLFEKTTNGQMNTQYSLHLQGGDQLNYRIVNGGNMNDTTIPASLNLEVDVWNHVVATYNGSLKSLYVNGQLIVNMPAVMPIDVNPEGASIIGSAGSGTDYFFNGSIDDLRVYNQAVPEENVSDLLKPASIDTSKKTTLPFTIVYTASDSSGNTTTVRRTVTVSDDAVPPVITLVGESEITINVGEVYEDEGATAIDDVDGNISFLIDTEGSEEIDTSKAGEHVVTYNVSDFSGNKATTVTRTVKVVESNPFNDWISNGPLKDLSPEDQAMDADPDADEIPNLLEYVMGGKPTIADRTDILPELKTTGRRLSITFIRIKPTKDPSISIKPMLTNNLGEPNAWDESAVSVQGVLEGVTQDNLPDGKPWATSDYERVRVISNVNMAAVPSGKEFIRIVVEKE